MFIHCPWGPDRIEVTEWLGSSSGGVDHKEEMSHCATGQAWSFVREESM